MKNEGAGYRCRLRVLALVSASIALGGCSGGGHGSGPGTDAGSMEASQGYDTGPPPMECEAGALGNQLVSKVSAVSSFLALDSTSVYWDSLKMIDACGLTGCNDQPTPIGQTQGEIDGVVADEAGVYWLERQGTTSLVHALVKGGGPDATVATANAQWSDLHVTGGQLRWLDLSSSRILQCATTGCNGQPVAIVQAKGTPLRLATDLSSVYWWENQSIKTCPVTGCSTPTVLASSLEPERMAVDATNLYWSFYNTGMKKSGAVYACALGGCGGKPTTLVSGLDDPFDIASDGKDVYWTVNESSDPCGPEVERCAISGCNGSPTPVAWSTFVFGQSLALDATNVYWISIDSLRSIPK